MKRSEMINKLMTLLVDYRGAIYYADVDELKEISDYILLEIENKGMIPPERVRYSVTKAGTDICCPECTWEPEDEV